MKPRHLAMVAALVAAAGLAFFGDKRPNAEVAEAVERAPAAVSTPAPARSANRADLPAAGEPAILRLLPRTDLLVGADGAGTAFGTQDWTPPPPPPPPSQPAPAPSAPPLPFTYLGKAVAEGSWEIYLARGDKTYIVKHKMVIDGVYRVDAIAPPTLTLTYLPLNQVQQLNIGVSDG